MELQGHKVASVENGRIAQEIADHGVLHQAQCVETWALGMGVLDDAVQALAHVRQQHPVRLRPWLHSG